MSSNQAGQGRRFASRVDSARPHTTEAVASPHATMPPLGRPPTSCSRGHLLAEEPLGSHGPSLAAVVEDEQPVYRLPASSTAPSSAPARNDAFASTSAIQPCPAIAVALATPLGPGAGSRGRSGGGRAAKDPLGARARRDRRRRRARGRPRGAAERIFDLDAPRRTVRRSAMDPEVTADVHADAGHVVGELAGDDVGREPLPNPPGSKPTPAGSRTRRATGSTSIRGAPSSRSSSGAASGTISVVRAVVAGAYHRAEDRRVETPTREADTVERALDERDRFWARPGPACRPARSSRSPRSPDGTCSRAPRAVDPLAAAVDGRRRGASRPRDGDQMDLGAHRSEARVSPHGWSSPPWSRAAPPSTVTDGFEAERSVVCDTALWTTVPSVRCSRSGPRG